MVFHDLGDQLLAVIAAGRHGADHRADPRLDEVHRRSVAAGASAQVPSDGGFLLEPEFSAQLVERLYNVGDILSRCSELPVSKPNSNGVKFPSFDETSRQNGSRLGGVVAVWASEASTVTISKPKVQLSTLELNKLLCFIQLTDELVSDAAALQTFAVASFASEMNFTVEQCIVQGSGAGRPLGVVNSGALVKVAPDNGQISGTVTGTNILACVQRLWAPSRRNACWWVNQSQLPQLQSLTTLVGGSERGLYKFASGGDQFDRLCGFPLFVSEYSSTAGQPGDILLGDFSRYVICKRQPKGDVSIHVNFLSDQQVMRFSLRIDGQPIDRVPVLSANSDLTTSPFVCVDART